MTTKAMDKWEAAWEAYVEALDKYDETKPLRERRGHVRAHKSARYQLRDARRKLFKLDPDFCTRLGINGD